MWACQACTYRFPITKQVGLPAEPQICCGLLSSGPRGLTSSTLLSPGDTADEADEEGRRRRPRRRGGLGERRLDRKCRLTPTGPGAWLADASSLRADGPSHFDPSALSKVRQHEGLLDAAPDSECRRANDDLLVRLAGGRAAATLVLTALTASFVTAAARRAITSGARTSRQRRLDQFLHVSAIRQVDVRHSTLAGVSARRATHEPADDGLRLRPILTTLTIIPFAIQDDRETRQRAHQLTGRRARLKHPAQRARPGPR